MDPMVVDPSGKTTIDFFVPSPDGKKVAVSLSKGGTESGDVTSSTWPPARSCPTSVVPRVNGGTAGGSLAWNADGTGFFYTRYPRGEERPAEDRDFYQQVYFHKLGTPTAKDTYALGKDFPRIAETSSCDVSDDGKYVLRRRGATATAASSRSTCAGPEGTWTQVSKFEDKVVDGARFGQDGALYLLSRKDAPRGKVLRLRWPRRRWTRPTVIVPEGEATIAGFVRHGQRASTSSSSSGGPSQLRMVGPGRARRWAWCPRRRCPRWAALRALRAVTTCSFATTATPSRRAWYRYTAKDGTVTKTALARTSPVDFSDSRWCARCARPRTAPRCRSPSSRKKGIEAERHQPHAAHRLRRLQRLASARASTRSTAPVARAGRRVRDRQPARRRRVRRGVAHGRHRSRRSRTCSTTSTPCAKLLVDQKLHAAEAAGHPGRQQRRPADGRGAHAAPGAVPRGGVARGHLRHAARRS